MWEIILSILSVIGIILLILVALFLMILILVLFYPVTYRIRGKKIREDTWVSAKMNWIFGFVRIRYVYPDPGRIEMKIFGKEILNSGNKKEKKNKEKESNIVSRGEKAEDDTKSLVHEEERITKGEAPETLPDDEQTGDINKGFFGKIEKIKYTIQKMYDKIKDIWDNLSYYNELLKEKETAELWEHVKVRLGKILKSIRPRHIKADILFGTGSPDTTGYILGFYGVLFPYLRGDFHVSPDFTRAVFQGEADISGHISVFVVLVNSLKLLLDRRLHLFLKKWKRKDNTGKTIE